MNLRSRERERERREVSFFSWDFLREFSCRTRKILYSLLQIGFRVSICCAENRMQTHKSLRYQFINSTFIYDGDRPRQTNISRNLPRIKVMKQKLGVSFPILSYPMWDIQRIEIGLFGNFGHFITIDKLR